jgi:Amt family ammonium transporter
MNPDNEPVVTNIVFNDVWYKIGIILFLVPAMLSYYVMTWRSKSNKIDESLDVFACHGVGGTWGVIATGIFATGAVSGVKGLIDGNWLQVPIQITAVAVITAFAFSATWLLAKLVEVTVGLRVSKEEETVGLDISQHGERAYGGLLR